MARTRILTPLLLALVAGAHGAAAEGAYPVSGVWTYENAAASGPADDKACRGRTMEFRGAQRLDTGSGVPQYRNVDVTRESSSSYRVVDEFFTVQIRGRVSYALRILDPDHIEIAISGKTFPLRRCGSTPAG